MSATTGASRQFHVQPWRHVVFLLFFLVLPVVVGVGFDMLTGAGGGGKGTRTAIGFVVLGQCIYIPLIWFQRLIVSADGIRLHILGSGLFTSWQNVERLYRGHGKHTGLVTREPMTGREVERWRWAANVGTTGRDYNFDDSEREWLNDGRYIPLSNYAHAVQRRTLQAAIAQYLPTLPGLDAPALAQSFDQGTNGRRNMWRVVGLSLVVFAIAYTVTVKQFPDVNGLVHPLIPFVLLSGGAIRTVIAAVANVRSGNWRHVIIWSVVALFLFALAAVNVVPATEPATVPSH